MNAYTGLGLLAVLLGLLIVWCVLKVSGRISDEENEDEYKDRQG